MVMQQLEHYKVITLPLIGKPNAIYFLYVDENTCKQYITDTQGKYRLVSDSTGNPGTVSTQNNVKTKVVLGETVSGGNLIYLSPTAKKYNQSDLNLYGEVVGICNSSGIIGEEIDIVISGECNQLGGLLPGTQYYAGENGLLMSWVPTSGVVQPVGVALNSTTLLVNIQKPYIKI